MQNIKIFKYEIYYFNRACIEVYYFDLNIFKWNLRFQNYAHRVTYERIVLDFFKTSEQSKRILDIEVSYKIALYVECTTNISVCVSVGFWYWGYSQTLPKAFRNTLIWIGSASYIERHFSWDLYIKYLLTQLNLLCRYKKSANFLKIMYFGYKYNESYQIIRKTIYSSL